LLYTGVTRGKKLVVLLGSHEAVRIAVQRQDANRRFTALQRRIREPAVSRSTDAGPVRR
jgi:exodeoxyribonuclease V alpha subunit